LMAARATCRNFDPDFMLSAGRPGALLSRVRRAGHAPCVRRWR
jgi:hypothetical protein